MGCGSVVQDHGGLLNSQHACAGAAGTIKGHRNCHHAPTTMWDLTSIDISIKCFLIISSILEFNEFCRAKCEMVQACVCRCVIVVRPSMRSE